jgi:electron transfer flavoprotein alpha/beta subunit
MLNITVCVKPVPDPKRWSEITLDPVRKTLKREGIPIIINPSDKHALEEALRIKDKLGAYVTVVSMAPAFAIDTLRETLAMGADDAVLLSDRLFAGADTLATAHVLAAGIKKTGRCDLVLCGNQSLDGSTGQVGPEVAEILGIPHLTGVRNISFIDNSEVRVECEIERGLMTLQAPLPLLAAVVGRINTPRHIPLARILKAAEGKIQVWTFNDLSIDKNLVGLEGSPTQVRNVFMPEVKRMREMIRGESNETAKLLLQRLYEIGALK